MAKRNRFKRTLGKDGRVRYFELKPDKRGINTYQQIPAKRGAKEFIKRNYDKVKSAPKTSLTAQEQKTLNRSRGQRNTIKYDGVRIPKKIVNILQNENILPSRIPNNELKNVNLPNIKRPADLVREYQNILKNANEVFVKSEWGLEGYRYRTQAENLVKIYDQVKPFTDEGYRFEVYESGEVFEGVDAYNAIRAFELMSISELGSDAAFARFQYTLYVDPKTMVVSIFLADTDVFVGESDPKQRTNNKRTSKR